MSNPQQERQQAYSYLDHRFPAPSPNAPIDDEPSTEEEELAVAEAREWLNTTPAFPLSR